MALCSVFVFISLLALGTASANNSAISIRSLDETRPTVIPLPLPTTVPPLPVATPTIVVVADSPKVVDPGGHIQLDVVITDVKMLNLKALVQWQGPKGEWHDVEGWQSVLILSSTTSSTTWWVAPADFSKGPFRWALYRFNRAQLNYVSERFWLPQSAGDWVRVQIHP